MPQISGLSGKTDGLLAEISIVSPKLQNSRVRTDMGGAGADITPQASVSGLRRVFDSVGPADSGRFLRYDGEALPW